MIIDRTSYLQKIDFQFSMHSVCCLLGPRQVGKTTLAKQYARNIPKAAFFDLENPLDLARLENPMLTLSAIDSDLIVIDEIQRRAELFPILRVLVDEKPRKFLLLGSASRDLIAQSSETLAGRVGYIEVMPLSLTETQTGYEPLWLRGGFPRSFFALKQDESYAWRQEYITTFMERDIPSLGFHIPPLHMRRLWMMLAHNHGNLLNLSDIGKSLGITHPTVRKYTDILVGTFMVRLLEPWFENTSKRLVKAPKIYIRDSGILHALHGLPGKNDLLVYPRLGASWEGFALEEIIKSLNARNEECFFWAVQSGAELDLLVIKDNKKIGFEFKYTDSPSLTKSMSIALSDLRLDMLYVIHPQKGSFLLQEKIQVIGLEEFVEQKKGRS